jgi:hypothetical protein
MMSNRIMLHAGNRGYLTREKTGKAAAIGFFASLQLFYA